MTNQLRDLGKKSIKHSIITVLLFYWAVIVCRDANSDNTITITNSDIVQFTIWLYAVYKSLKDTGTSLSNYLTYSQETDEKIMKIINKNWDHQEKINQISRMARKDHGVLSIIKKDLNKNNNPKKSTFKNIDEYNQFINILNSVVKKVNTK